MMGHVHAELMAQYAEDARETDRPWERWECHSGYGAWTPCELHPDWNRSFSYRRKPRTITINGREVPEPMRKAPEIGGIFYVVDLTSESSCTECEWAGSSYEARWLFRGLCHSTREAVIAHAEALLSFTEAK